MVNFRIISKIIGSLLFIEAFFMSWCAIMALSYGEDDQMAFLVSMLMTSVVRLRVINLIGSIIFAGYALMIRSYPTAIMNIALAGINIYQLMKLFNEKKSYHLIKSSQHDGFFSYMLSCCDEDIRHIFPDYSLEGVSADIAYIVICGSDPACLFLGKESQPGTIETVLDYATPAYRDTSVGRFLYKKLAEESEQDVKYSKELTATLVSKLTEEEYQQLMDETAGLLTKSKIKQLVRGDMKWLLFATVGAFAWYYISKWRNA